MIEREEFKFPFTANDLFEVRRFLESQSMFLVHEMRTVNSLYFDDLNLKSHELGEEGITPRHKIRLRWYGDQKSDLMNSRLEVKSTLPSQRTKKSIEFQLLLGLEKDDYFLPIKHDILQRKLIPTVAVNYKRCYFQNLVGMRATLDYGINYSRGILTADYKMLLGKTVYEQENVLEAKGDTKRCRQMILASRLTWMRFSKYSRGVLSMN